MAAAKKTKKPNWTRIQTEYVTGQISQRDLAKKHGVPYRTLADRCKAEGWVALRAEHKRKTVAKAAEKIGDQQADQMAQLLTTAASELLSMAMAGIRQLDQPVREHTEIFEECEGLTRKTTWLTQDGHGGPVDSKAARNLSGVLRDVRDILGVKSELERQEQEARIAKLRADAEAKKDDAGEDDGEIRLIMVNNAEDYIG